MAEVWQAGIEEGTPLWCALKVRNEFSISEFARILAGYPPYREDDWQSEDGQIIKIFEEALLEELQIQEVLPAELQDIEEDIPF